MSRRKKKSRGLYDEFISEYNRLKLTKLEPYVLADIIVQANRRRKREAAKWKHEATAYRKQFIRERDAHVRTQNNFRKHLDDCERREQTLRSREEDYLRQSSAAGSGPQPTNPAEAAVAGVMQQAMREHLHPLVTQMTQLLGQTSRPASTQGYSAANT